MVHGAITWRGPTTTRRLHPLLFRCTMPALTSTRLPCLRSAPSPCSRWRTPPDPAARSPPRPCEEPPCPSPRGEEGDEGRGRSSGEPPARRSWEALFPPPEEAPEDELHLPSADQRSFFAAALLAAAVDAAGRAADKTNATRGGLAPPWEDPPSPCRRRSSSRGPRRRRRREGPRSRVFPSCRCWPRGRGQPHPFRAGSLLSLSSWRYPQRR